MSKVTLYEAGLFSSCCDQKLLLLKTHSSLFCGSKSYGLKTYKWRHLECFWKICFSPWLILHCKYNKSWKLANWPSTLFSKTLSIISFRSFSRTNHDVYTTNVCPKFCFFANCLTMKELLLCLKIKFMDWRKL